MRRLVLAALLAALASSARAESPRLGSFDLLVGQYRPDIDSEFPQRPPEERPWQKAFGTRRPLLFRAGASKALFQAFGSLEVGLQVGFLQKSGFGQLAAGGASGDPTKFRAIPASATLTYRFDWPADRFRIPLAPYGRVALERYHWWITDGAGHTSQSGATNGWSAAGGLALLLDFFDPTLARELDADSGVNHTYLFVEARKTFVDDFGSSSSWDLSDDRLSWSGGLLLVF